MVLAANPFPVTALGRNVALFLDAPLAPDAVGTVTERQGEKLRSS